jgi:hypothetical protein
MAPVVAAAPAAGNLVNLATQLTAANVAPAVIQSILQSQMGQPAAAPMSTPPGFNRQNIVAPLLSSAVGSSIPDLVAALRGKLPDASDAPGSKAILSEDLLPRLIEQERARQRFGRFFGLDSGPSAQDVYGQILSDRSTQLEELGARERALKALEGQIQSAIRQMELGADLKRTELEVGGGIKRQELSSLGDIQRQRVQSGYSAAQGLLNTAIQNMTAPQNLAQSSVLQQLATQVP